MLPSLAALRISSTDGSFDDPDINTDMKRARDAAWSLVNQASLNAGRFPKDYARLVNDIVERLPKPRGTPSLEFYALQQLHALLEGADPSTVFEPSNEARYASVSPKSVTKDMASRIALAFFKSKAEAPPPVLSDFDEPRRQRAQALLDRLSTKTPEELTWGDKYDKDTALSTLRELDDRTGTTADLFAEEHADLVRTFVNEAVDSFLLLPDSASRPLLNATVQLVLQPVDATTYNPIADAKHMDGEFDFSKTGGTRYGRPASEQDVSSLVMSFCADLVSSGEVALSPCSTVYFKNAPIVKLELLVEAARAIQRQPEMSVKTEYEIISEMGNALIRATSSALEERSEQDLQRMGIVGSAVNMLYWTNANSLAFHRSALRDEVLAGAVRTTEGRAMPRMRAFAILLTDNPSGDDRQAVTSGMTNVIKLPNIIRGGRQIKVSASVTVLRGGQNAGMGEDMMP